MRLFVTLTSGFALFVGALVVFHVFVRRDCQRKGRLTPFSGFPSS